MAKKEEIVKQLEDDLKDFDNLINNLAQSLQGKLNARLVDTKEAIEDLTEAFKKGEDVSKQIEDNIKRLNKESTKLILDKKSLETQLADLANKRYSMSQKQFNKQKNILDQQLKEIEAQLELNEAEGAYLEQLKNANKTLNVSSEIYSKINNTLKDKIKSVSSFAFIWKFLIDAFFKADKQITDLGKNLGVSSDAARDIRNEFQQYVNASKDGYINVGRLIEAQIELTEQIGFGAKFSEQELETYSRLTKLVGLSAQEAGKLTEQAAAVGMENTEYVSSLRRSVFLSQQANKIHISDKELLSTISKTSAGILIKFKGNVDALGKAIVQAKKLGTTLEQVDKIGDSMLNWEQSIEKELEAELITGKQLNFERARAAALSNDQATLMEEIAAQAGSLAEFSNMTSVAQNSLAEAFGMSREEMAEMLTKQEAINTYGNKAAELNAKQLEDLKKSGLSLDEYIAKQNEKQNLQEKFNNAMERLQEIVGGLVEGPFGKLLHVVADILSNTYALAAITSIYITKLGVVAALKAREIILSRRSAASDAAGAAAGAAKSAASIPVVGWVLAGVAALSLFALLSGLLSKGDDVVSPGYGKRTLLAPEGAIALNDKDTVIAGTNLGGGGNKGGGGGGESMGMVVAAIKDLQNSINRLASRPVTINMDGAQVGTIVGRRNETGTEQVKNSYSLA